MTITLFTYMQMEQAHHDAVCLAAQFEVHFIFAGAL